MTDRRLEKMVAQYLKLQKECNEAQMELENRTKLFRVVEEEELPALLDELGLVKVTLDDGVTTVRKHEELTASVSKRNEIEAAKLFKRLKAGDLVQLCADFKFTAADREAAKKLFEFSKKEHIPVETYNYVNTGSLKAWVREQLRASQLQPADLEVLGVFRRTVAEVKVKPS